jgi:hypothetical protein
MAGTPKSDQYAPEEAQCRTEAALRAAFNAPHKPQSEMKLGKTMRKASRNLDKGKAKKK